MGTCTSSSAIHPNVTPGTPIGSSMKSEGSEISSEIKENVDSLETLQFNAMSHQKKCKGDSEENILNTDLDWSSEEEILSSFPHGNLNSERVKKVEEIARMDTSEDGDDGEQGDIFWIPASLASHMGLRTGPVCHLVEESRPRDRIYADDADLFMSVETDRRSHVTDRRSHVTDFSHKSKADNMTVQNSFVNNNAIDLISLGRN